MTDQQDPLSGSVLDGASSDTFETRESRSWFQRIGDSLRAIVIGLLLVVASIVLLAWNEGRAVKTARALEEGSAAVVSIPSDARQESYEGRLVHISGPARAPNPVADSELGVSANGLKLARHVEMFQWREERRSETVKKLGGGEETVTRYSYLREWSDRAIESSRFQSPSGHVNPAMPALGSRVFYAQDARIGAFSIGHGVVDALETADSVAVPAATLAVARSNFGPRARVEQGSIHVGDPATPSVGDIRVSYKLAPAQEVSVAGRQAGSAIAPYRATNGREILLVAAGLQTADAMFQHSLEENSIITWIVRAGGALVLFIGLRLMMSLLPVLADLIPFVGDIVGAGMSLIAFTMTLVIAPTVIALAWLAYRPLLSLIVLGAGAACAYGAMQLGRARHKTRQAPA